MKLDMVILVAWNPNPVYGDRELCYFVTYISKEIVVWLNGAEWLILFDGVQGRLTIKSKGDGAGA